MTNKNITVDFPLSSWFVLFPNENGAKGTCQGQIIRKIDETHYLILLFSWLSGEPIEAIVRNIDAMMFGWRFFADKESWREAGDVDLKNTKA